LFVELCGIMRKTVAVAEPLREALGPLAPQIAPAFVYGSVAKGADSASSDVDLMIISDTVTYADAYSALEPIRAILGRPVNPTVYSRRELAKRNKGDNAFVT
jgi:predicted nucleotidyltransferase